MFCLDARRLRAVHRNFAFSYFEFMTEVSWVVRRCGQAGGCGRNFPRYQTYAVPPSRDRPDILKLSVIFGAPSGTTSRALSSEKTTAMRESAELQSNYDG